MKKILSFFAIAALVLGMASCNGNDPEAAEPSKGELNGVFSVGNGKQVRFSQGNLQFEKRVSIHSGTTLIWSFAEHQYDVLGKDKNERIGTTALPGYKIDLFGWGTGDNPGKHSINDADYATFTDWGMNKISNGGKEPNFWRSLSKDEWLYIIRDRSNAKNLVAWATLEFADNRLGLFLLPDNWEEVKPSGISLSTNASWGANLINETDWNAMEKAGAVFLPYTGVYRDGQTIVEGNNGYWNSISDDDVTYASVFVTSIIYNFITIQNKHCGHYVRLVHELPKTDGQYVYPTTLHQAQEELESWSELSHGIANYLNERVPLRN